jgi:3-hydroxyacyl-CoA dehydrogenase
MIEALPAGTAASLDLTKIYIDAFMAIGMAKVSMSAAQAVSIGHLHPWKDRIVFNRDLLIGEAKKEALAMADAGWTPPMKKDLPVVGISGTGMVNAELYNMANGLFMSEYDAFLAKRIAYVIAGGDVKYGTKVSEEHVLRLEREAFVDFCKEEKTLARIDHMLKTNKPLRN